jgi:WD40 repeat protein
VALSSDGRWIVSAYQDQTFRVRDLDGQPTSRALQGNSDAIRAVVVSADGRRVVSGSEDSTVRVWDVESHGAPSIMQGHGDSVQAVALSASRRWLASGSSDHTVRVWDLNSLSCRSVFTCDFPVSSCDWKLDVIAAGDTRGKVHLFRWEE